MRIHFGFLALLLSSMLGAGCGNSTGEWIAVGEKGRWFNTATGCNFTPDTKGAVRLQKIPDYPGRIVTLILVRQGAEVRERVFIGVQGWDESLWPAAMIDSVRQEVKKICAPQVLALLPDSLKKYAREVLPAVQ